MLMMMIALILCDLFFGQGSVDDDDDYNHDDDDYIDGDQCQGSVDQAVQVCSMMMIVMMMLIYADNLAARTPPPLQVM